MTTFWEPDADNDESYVDLTVNTTIATFPWAKLTIGPVTLPGFSVVEASPSWAIDKKKAAAQSGGRLTFHGKKVGVDVDIKVHLWTPAHWNAWVTEVLPVLWPLGAKGPAAWDVSHPALDGLGIRSITVEKVSSPKEGRVAGERIVEVKAIAYDPPAPSPTKTLKAAEVAVLPEFNPTLTLQLPAGVASAAAALGGAIASDKRVQGLADLFRPANAAVKPSSKPPGP